MGERNEKEESWRAGKEGEGKGEEKIFWDCQNAWMITPIKSLCPSSFLEGLRPSKFKLLKLGCYLRKRVCVCVCEYVVDLGETECFYLDSHIKIKCPYGEITITYFEHLSLWTELDTLCMYTHKIVVEMIRQKLSTGTRN